MASTASTSEEREKLSGWARRLDTSKGVNALLSLARSELGLVRPADSFDRNPYLLNTGSGIVDLKTGEVSVNDPEAMMTKIAPCFYNPGGACPQWLSFLDTIMGGNAQLIEYLQRVGGYSLTGDTGEQCLFLLYGSGANGKSTFLEVIWRLLGDYANKANPETFMSHTGDGPRPDVARLRGARFVSTVETEDGKKLAEGLVKQLTGGDAIVARFLYKDEFEFVPQFKLFLATNHKPTIRSTDYAIWRRIRLIPFVVQIPETQRIKNLALKLVREEGSAILAWFVQGCLDWQGMGLCDPPEVKAATTDYRKQQDLLEPFIQDCCEMVPNAETKDLYRAYAAWADSNGEHPISSRRFSMLLTERGVTSLGKARHMGIKLAT
jgi:putative DNA primase/helicase